MTYAMTNPLQDLIDAAAKTKAHTGATAAAAKRVNTGNTATVILADVSSSMDEPAGGRRKCEILEEALDMTLAGIPQPQIVAFASVASVVASPSDLPAPNGGTDLCRALELAATLDPRQTIVISDGQPDNKASALAAADRLPGTIDVIYVGPDSDRDAIAFMQALARRGMGRCYTHDLRREPRALAPAIRALIAP